MESLNLSEEARTRILQNCLEAEKAPSPVRHRRRMTPVRFAAAAAIIALLTVTAGAVGLKLFNNPTIVDSREDIPVDIDGSTLSGVLIPLDTPASSLETIQEEWQQTYLHWDTDVLGQTVRPGSAFTETEQLSTEGDPLTRTLRNPEGGAVKHEYAAQDPQTLSTLPQTFTADFQALSKQYTPVPKTSLYVTEEDSDGSWVGEVFQTLYQGPSAGSWFTLNYRHDADRDFASQDFVTREDHTEAYTYTTASGLEFLITAYGDMVWASCGTQHSYLDFTAAFLTTEQMEAILDCAAVTLKGIG